MDHLLSSTTNQAPGYLIFHYFWTYAITSTRPLKFYLGIDHNVAPREDMYVDRICYLVSFARILTVL